MRRFSLPAWCLAIAAALCLISTASAEERILRFQSDIDVQADGRLIVTETITVRAEGNEIKRGIFRDIPLRARDAGGWEHQVGFELLDVRQDGGGASYFTRDSTSGVRIYIGREDVFLEPGNYTYTIQYEMDRQIRFFGDYDEVYWNVTGNEWVFPIDEAVARVRLPGGARPTDLAAYTGPFGSDGGEYEALVDESTGEVVFRTTQPLGPNEGLTVAAGFPKGIAIEPTSTEKLQIWLEDQRVFAIGSAGILALVLYYVLSWWRVGRDPARGVIFPRFEAPDGISPALANYIANRGIEGGRWTALSAACLNLAIKGRMTLTKEGPTMVLGLKDGPPDAQAGPFPKGEAAVESYLAARGTPLPLDEANGKSVSALGDKFVSAITKEYGGVYFRENGAYLLPGLAVSVATIAALFYFGNLSDAQFEQAFLFGFFTIFGIAISVGLTFLVQNLLIKPLIGAELPAIGFWLVFAVIFSGAVYLVSLLVTLILGTPQEVPLLPAFVIGIVIMFLIYANVIDVPTDHGRTVMDAIDGLKLYLSVAEKDRLNMTDAPDMSVLHFEKLLPYAVSLGVEKPWSSHFETWLSAAAAGPREYHPNWYRGRDFDGRDISRSIGTTASAMAGSFQSSLPVSSSSSSGSSGGGSSGGGGGGGGGGGW